MVKNNHYQDQPKGAPGAPADPPGLPPGLGAMGLGGPRPQIPNLPGPRGPSPGATGPMASPNVPPAKEKRKKSLPVRNLLQNMLKMRWNFSYCCINKTSYTFRWESFWSLKGLNKSWQGKQEKLRVVKQLERLLAKNVETRFQCISSWTTSG